MRVIRSVVTALASLLVTGAASAATPVVTIAVEEVVSPRAGSWPTHEMVQSTADPSRWFVAEMDGTVSVYQDGASFTRLGTLLDITDRVATEYFGTNPGFGLFSLALHPDFAGNGEAFVYYTAETDPYEVRLSRFTSPDGGLTLDPDSEQVILAVELSDPKHLGGHMAFGPDGYLYKDFGYGPDPANGQDLDNLWGTFVRLDVDGAAPYEIPEGNPLADGGGLPEIWAWGFRNPWRFSFDRETGELWTGDVGEDSWEEIDLVIGGGNYGWPIREGAHCYPVPPCDATGLIDPVTDYPHEGGSPFVVGGYVYRGSRIPGLIGVYVYAEGSGAKVRALFTDEAGEPSPQPLLNVGGSLRSFAQGLDGELYLVNGAGYVYRIVPVPGQSDADTDGVMDDQDNCLLVANADQRDTNGDGYGNVCDADLTDDGAINFADLAVFKSRFLSNDPDADFDGDGSANFGDLALMKASFLSAPGPSAQAP